MTVTAVRKDAETLTMTVDAEFVARRPSECGRCGPIHASWSAGGARPPTPPPSPPTTSAPGSRVEYHMTGPEGDQPRGYWEILEAEPPRSLVFRDGFANTDGSPNPELPSMTARVAIEDIGGGRTRMSIESSFPDAAAMEQILAMGAEEGLTQAIGQIEAILADDVATSAGGLMRVSVARHLGVRGHRHLRRRT